MLLFLENLNTKNWHLREELLTLIIYHVINQSKAKSIVNEEWVSTIAQCASDAKPKVNMNQVSQMAIEALATIAFYINQSETLKALQKNQFYNEMQILQQRYCIIKIRSR